MALTNYAGGFSPTSLPGHIFVTVRIQSAYDCSQGMNLSFKSVKSHLGQGVSSAQQLRMCTTGIKQISTLRKTAINSNQKNWVERIELSLSTYLSISGRALSHLVNGSVAHTTF